MKYFEYIVLIGLLLAIILIIFAIIFSLRKQHLLNLCKINILRQQQKLNNCNFFNEYMLTKIIQTLFFSFNPEAKLALAYLAYGKTAKAVKYFKNRNLIFSAFLQALYEPNKVYVYLRKKPKIWQNSVQNKLFTAMLALHNFDFCAITKIFYKLNFKHLSKPNRAYYNYVSAFAYLQEADMLSASQNASEALKFFKQKNYIFEEAYCYLLLAEIYKICCVNDIAQTMIESAKKIFSHYKLNTFCSQATTFLGRLMLFENRFDEAEDKFNLALNLTDNQQTLSEIYNQFALLYIAQKKYSEALKFAKKSLSFSEKNQNLRGQAFSLQLLAQIYAEKKMHRNTIIFAQKAYLLYEKQNNFSAYCECLYLEAGAYYKQDKLKKSALLLRNILQLQNKQKLNFHFANAYSLLGIIYLKNNDFQRAKVLFQQSLHLEQFNERVEGMISDYANLAIIDNLNGNNDLAKQNLQIALEYAQKAEDEYLIKLIEDKIKKLS